MTSAPDIPARASAPGDEFRIFPAEHTWRAVRLGFQSWWVPASALRAYGAERVPQHGPCVLAMNHVHALDPFTIGMASPRSIRYMAKVELFEIPVVGRVLPHTGSFAVRRGESDRDAIRLARQVLEAGHCLGIFVEGTRQPAGEIGEVKPGAAMLAMAEGVPVLPVCVQQHRPPGRLLPAASVAFGTPLSLDGLPRGGRGYRRAADLIAAELGRLREFVLAAERAGRPVHATPPVTTVSEPVHGRP